MKKWFIWLILLLTITVAAVYIIIPAEIRVRKVMVIKANEKGVYSFLQSQAGIAKWWPEKNAGTRLNFNNGSYTINQLLLHGIKVNIDKNSRNLGSEIEVTALNVDDIEVVWTTSVAAGTNPISRVMAYNDAAGIKKDMGSILLTLKNFLEKMENIYGLKVERSKIKDTLMVAMEATTTGMPGNNVVYELVQKLEQYIATNGATATNAPMLNIFTEDSIRFNSMLAIPINKEVPETPVFRIKRMIPGNVLITEIKGGPATIKQSLQRFDMYRGNYNYTAPAKPFQSLITNRLTETDSSKWITKLYWPVY